MKTKLFLLAVFAIGFISCSHDEGKDKTEKPACCKKPDSLTGTLNYSKESIYQVGGEWKNQNGEKTELNKLSGKVQVVAMIFTSCKYACPKIISDIQSIESKIPPDKRDKVNFLLITFDLVRDTPERLKTFANEMNMNEHWVLLHGTEQSVQEIAVALGVKFEKQDDGSFAHSNLITILDRNGAIAYQQEGLGANAENTMKTIAELTK